RVLLGDGKGGIATAYDLGTASDRSYSGRLVDLDGDGDLDVVISNDAPDPKLVYLNDGKGHFHVGSSYGNPKWSTRNATVADVNAVRAHRARRERRRPAGHHRRPCRVAVYHIWQRRHGSPLRGHALWRRQRHGVRFRDRRPRSQRRARHRGSAV